MLHNKASEGLVKTDRVRYDLYSGIADTKALFFRFCRQFEKRIRSLVPSHRVVPACDGEASTTISVPGFVVDAKLKIKTFAPQKVELQFPQDAVFGPPSRVHQVRVRSAIRGIIAKL
jgi:hypothetical protein